jgi:hypothetical protein
VRTDRTWLAYTRVRPYIAAVAILLVVGVAWVETRHATSGERIASLESQVEQLTWEVRNLRLLACGFHQYEDLSVVPEDGDDARFECESLIDR